jgi:hypothetical protein
MPARYAPIVFSLILSAIMSLIVSGIATLRNAGPVEGFAGLWLGAWLFSWTIAFPVVLVVAPATRRLVGRLTAATPARG